MSVPLGMLFCLTGKVCFVHFLGGGVIRRREGRGEGMKKLRAQGFLLWNHAIIHKALHIQHLEEPREVKPQYSLILNLKEDEDKLLFVQH